MVTQGIRSSYISAWVYVRYTQMSRSSILYTKLPSRAYVPYTKVHRANVFKQRYLSFGLRIEQRARSTLLPDFHRKQFLVLIIYLLEAIPNRAESSMLGQLKQFAYYLVLVLLSLSVGLQHIVLLKQRETRPQGSTSLHHRIQSAEAHGLTIVSHN